MGQFDANATKEQLVQMEREFARKREAAALRRAKELARLSDERVFVDAYGTEWAYIVVDGSFACVCGCETECETLAVPGELEGYPVLELDAEALSGLESPREIVCADVIERIGPYAFRRCPNLRRLVLPAETGDFSSSWIASCPSMEELVLPGKLEAISADAFACSSLETLRIPASVARLGRSVAERTNVQHSGAGATFCIDARNAAYFVDECGCLHARGELIYRL